MSKEVTGYWWVRIFDYNFERDRFDKGILLDEYYLKDIFDRETAKQEVKDKSGIGTFARPKKGKNGTYAIVMDSEKHWHDRFCVELDTFCFWCHKPIKGRMKDFPYYDATTDGQDKYHFCSYNCKSKFYNSQNPCLEGEWQEKEDYKTNGGVFGYIYLIYNRDNNTYYIGQTRFMPFFRWQEHVKSGIKGDIKDLVFSVITEVKHDNRKTNTENQELLNNIEAWWIKKFREEMDADKVINIATPRLTIDDLKEKFKVMVEKQMALEG